MKLHEYTSILLLLWVIIAKLYFVNKVITLIFTLILSFLTIISAISEINKEVEE